MTMFLQQRIEVFFMLQTLRTGDEGVIRSEVWVASSR